MSKESRREIISSICMVAGMAMIVASLVMGPEKSTGLHVLMVTGLATMTTVLGATLLLQDRETKRVRARHQALGVSWLAYLNRLADAVNGNSFNVKVVVGTDMLYIPADNDTPNVNIRFRRNAEGHFTVERFLVYSDIANDDPSRTGQAISNMLYHIQRAHQS